MAVRLQLQLVTTTTIITIFLTSPLLTSITTTTLNITCIQALRLQYIPPLDQLQRPLLRYRLQQLLQLKRTIISTHIIHNSNWILSRTDLLDMEPLVLSGEYRK
ncbi:gamma-aminobutyric acid receptor subunit rho-1 [Platysternon megacephalum]|uniref:Gamma-aminobutyric acid receptor subunit rho-1 n=1 Tax=Platysternon megacephalum TaxID=55544 RepID=A0A4D9EPW1_9SAUR|nr:gamma-aminobutyric acid receptor subunit rho-1 [Platysternon megacephalum]